MTRSFVRLLAAMGLLLAAWSALAPAAEAQTAPTTPVGSAIQVQQENGPGPASPALSATAAYNADALGAGGGGRSGTMYEGRLGLILDEDLDQLFGWRDATAHLSLHAIHGSGVAGDEAQNLMTVSGLEAEPTVRLFNLWVQQQLGPSASLRVGQFTAAQEFALSSTANLFVNSTFGWPALFSADLPSGGPSYPLAAPGARVSYMADSSTTVLAAIFSGDPAGRGDGDPQARDRFGLNGFNLAGAPFVIVELQHAIGSGRDPPTLKLGAWRHFDRFPDLASGSGVHRGDMAGYMIVDAPIWSAGSRSLRGFVRASLSPSDRNRVDRYLDAGMSLSPVFPSRPGDTLGFAVAAAHLRPDPSGGLAAGGTETILEATYQLRLRDQVYLQPDVQYVIHANGGAGRFPYGNALVAGVRVSMRFGPAGLLPARTAP